MPGAGRLEVAIAAKSWGRKAGRGRVAQRPVLREVAFAAEPGECLALLGPSGTGKTTTFRIVLGLDTDFTGSVHRPEGRIGTMFQDPRLLTWLTIEANLRLVAGDKLPTATVARVLEEVGLPGAAKRFPGELSLGMARRAALARALVVEPSLLVLDEPFASLDPRLSASLAAVVARAVRRLRAATLLATHSIDHALATADRILVLSGQPATLAADLPVPDPSDLAGRNALRRELTARFPFLDAEPDSGPERDDDTIRRGAARYHDE